MRTAWMLSQWVVLLLLFAYAGLFLEIRYDHNHMLLRKDIAWTPIVYSAVMVAAGILALRFWNSGGRAGMQWFFAAGIIVGLLGFWLHSMGHPINRIEAMLSTWTGSHPDPQANPPVLAPLSFAGLGALGWAACLSRFSRTSGAVEAPEERNA